jgi:hypothetical protein
VSFLYIIPFSEFATLVISPIYALRSLTHVSDTLPLSVAKALFHPSISSALRLQEERAMRPGRGSHNHWYLSAAYSLVCIKLDPLRSEVFRREAADRVAKLLYKILSLQDSTDEYLANEVSYSLRLLDNLPILSPYISPFTPYLLVLFSIHERNLTSIQVVLGDEALPTSNLNPNDNAGQVSNTFPFRLDSLDFSNTSEWMLDDFWHFNDFPAVPFNG